MARQTHLFRHSLPWLLSLALIGAFFYGSPFFSKKQTSPAPLALSPPSLPSASLPSSPPLEEQAWDDLSLLRLQDRVAAVLSQLAETFSKQYGEKARISHRVKSLASLRNKLLNRQQTPGSLLEKVSDIGGMRFIFKDLQSLYAVTEEIESTYEVIKKRDYNFSPKEDGYRSLHIVILEQAIPIELQMRTEGMHRWATWSHDLLYKNSERLEFLVGQEKLNEFRDFSKKLSDHFFLLETGVARPAPSPPKELSILWEFASSDVRALLHPSGVPLLHPVRPKPLPCQCP